ncbi:hypothetical protein [Pseudomonas viridiflava]|uniref:hypothetical protein n=1 Tax=Pseudomonas viridiflava TaxID=33069 RepID=UPI000F02D791|nr:hypothetical protein [Pseudomonas viridiflava]MDY0918432.1 hypothetical protein [Pseudomonas viridiflava]
MTQNTLTAAQALLYLSVVREATQSVIDSAPITMARLGGQKFVASRLRGASPMLAPVPILSADEWEEMAREHAEQTTASLRR